MLVRSGDGRPDAPIMIVGEAWGENEERQGTSFVGASGQELNVMLHEAGLMRSDCYVTNVVNARPPGNNIEKWIPVKKTDVEADMVRLRGKFVKPVVMAGYEALLREIALVKPKIIITLGNTSLWALTGRTAVTKWRGSLLSYNGVRLIPTYHPAAILRMWEWRAIAIFDLKRAARELVCVTPRPAWNFIIGPGQDKVISTLQMLMTKAEEGADLWLDFDIETVCGHIRCFAISWSRAESLCVPLMTASDREGYWPVEIEGLILWHIYKLFTHPKVKIRGQNLLYDYQYVFKHWHFIPNLGQDTMISHHTLWAGLPKNLAFQASLYAGYYEYWKDLVKHDAEKEGA